MNNNTKSNYICSLCGSDKRSKIKCRLNKKRTRYCRLHSRVVCYNVSGTCTNCFSAKYKNGDDFMNMNYCNNNRYQDNTYCFPNPNTPRYDFEPITNFEPIQNSAYDIAYNQPAQIITGPPQSQPPQLQPPQSQSPVPETVESTLFVPGFLQSQIGKLMRVEFLVGTTVQDRVGVLRQVGASYIIIQPVGESSMIMCDLFSIRFATIINRPIDGETIVVT